MFDSGVGSTDLSLSSSLASASISQTPLAPSSSISASSPVMPSSTAQSSVAAASAPLPSAEQSSASAMLAKRERRLRLEKVGSYRVGRTLGRGNFAQVRIAYHEVANAKVAMKIVDKRSLDAENLAKIEREIQILQRLSHPFIVKLFEVIRTERCLYIVTEYVPNGELFDMLMDRGRQTEAESRRLFQQIVSAVAHCHANGIVHRDLKAENLLLDKKGNIKIIDFGFSNYQQPDQLLSTWCGSPPYAAPELLLAQEYDGRQSDVWSLGVILYILVTAGFPFPGDSVEKLKRAVLADHLKIPFWVSVECADLIRKMLTVSPVKRYTLQQVIQHRWMTSKMPDQIKRLLAESSNRRDGANANNQSPLANGRTPLDPTVLVFMQQQTGWSDDQITEEVLNRNYESPIFGTYELLLSRLSQFRDAEMASGSSIGAAMAVGGNLHLENEQTRRGSRGSIISGRANVEPAEAPICPTIPAHHLAKLSLSTSPDYQESEDSDSASDLLDAEDTAVSPRFSQSHPQPNAYKSRHRAYRRGRAEHQQQMEREQQAQQAQQRLPYALEYHQLNPLLNAAAQQFAVDTSRAWANAAAAAALFASQLQQQNSGSSGVGPTAAAAQQQFQQAAALNLVSLQNFPFVDYARMMHVPNQERRASANEALLGLNSYAHLLAACSTMGMGGGGGNGGGGGDTRCSSSQGTSSSPRQPTQQPHHRASYHQQPRRSVEEEGEFYLSQRGSSKRNTVHSITGGMTLLGSAGGAGTSTGGVNAAGGGAFQSTQSAFQRHKPYFKQGSTGPSGSSSVAAGGVERRSSWASSSAAGGSAALAINAQQQAQLERIYRQSIGQQTNAIASTGAPNQAVDAAAAALSGVQQLQLEFQKLCASTKDNSPGPGGGINIATSASVAGLFLEPPSPAQQPQMPTINITDENNQKVGSAFVPPSTDSTSSITSQQPQIMSILAGTIQPQSATPDSGGVPQQANPFSQSLPHQRPATVCGFSANIATGGNSSPSSPSEPQIKNLFIPVSLQTALERLQRFVQNHQLLCEIQSDEPNASIQTVNSVRIRVAPSAKSNDPNATVNPAKTTTILELALHRMDQSPNISRATFQLIQGDLAEFDALKANLLATFNEVL